MQNKYFISFEELSLCASISFPVPELALISQRPWLLFIYKNARKDRSKTCQVFNNARRESKKNSTCIYYIIYIFQAHHVN
jgi:hypothetical protein